jgi:hypothetical protein
MILAGIFGVLYGSKRFFFEKKNQKTFDRLHARLPHDVRPGPKVFCFFFSKKKTFLTRQD